MLTNIKLGTVGTKSDRLRVHWTESETQRVKMGQAIAIILLLTAGIWLLYQIDKYEGVHRKSNLNEDNGNNYVILGRKVNAGCSTNIGEVRLDKVDDRTADRGGGDDEFDKFFEGTIFYEENKFSHENVSDPKEEENEEDLETGVNETMPNEQEKNVTISVVEEEDEEVVTSEERNEDSDLREFEEISLQPSGEVEIDYALEEIRFDDENGISEDVRKKIEYEENILNKGIKLRVNELNEVEFREENDIPLVSESENTNDTKNISFVIEETEGDIASEEFIIHISRNEQEGGDINISLQAENDAENID